MMSAYPSHHAPFPRAHLAGLPLQDVGLSYSLDFRAGQPWEGQGGRGHEKVKGPAATPIKNTKKKKKISI